MGWLAKLTGKREGAEVPAQARPRAAAPAQRTAKRAAPAAPSWPALKAVRLAADGRLSVVGESNYQPALHAAVSGRHARGFDYAVPVTALLMPEPSNPYDRNAVRVDVDGRTVGYLAREDAVQYQPALVELAEQGKVGTCHAFICSGDYGLYGIWLHISSPDRLVPLNSPDGLSLLSAERQVTVTGEEAHQDVLAGLAKLGRGAETMSMFASLATCTIVKAKHAGGPAVEVRIDGQRVGELTKLQSDRYLDLVRQSLTRGAQLGCDATLRHAGDKGWQVELQLPVPA